MDLQRERGACPQLGKGLGCGGRDCRLSWPLTLEDNFLPAERCRGLPRRLFHLRHQHWLKGSGNLLLPPSCHYGEHSALATRVQPCFLRHPASHCFQRYHTSENGARWKPHLSQSDTRWRELGKKQVGSTCRQIWGGDDSSEGGWYVTFWRGEARWER